MKKTVFTSASLLFVMCAAQAQMAPPNSIIIPAPMHFFVGMNATGGGDELITAERTDGKSSTIKAGQGITFAAGVDYRITPAFSMQASLGYQTDKENANNGRLEFTRYPFELLAFYHPSANWRIGGGLRYVSSPTLKGSGVVSMPDIDFDNTTSGVIEGEWLAGPHLGIQLRYVHERFKLDGYRGDISGDQGGIGIRYYF